MERIGPCRFLNTAKTHIVQVISKSVSHFPFVFWYVKKNEAPLFVPLCRFGDSDTLVSVGKCSLLAVLIQRQCNGSVGIFTCIDQSGFIERLNSTVCCLLIDIFPC